MKVSQIRAFTVFCITLLLPVQFTPAESVDPAVEQFLARSLGDFSEELEAAKNAGKKGVMLFFEQQGCPYCFKMKTQVFNQKKVRDYFNRHFAVYGVDIRNTEEIADFSGKKATQRQFAHRYTNGQDITPVIAFFDLEGRLVARYIGATADAKEFMLLGDYVVTRAYRNKSFRSYKRQLSAQ